MTAVRTRPGALWWVANGLVLLAAITFLASTRQGMDWMGHAVGRDFVNYWTAGRLVHEGEAASVFQPQAFEAALDRYFDLGWRHIWSYPPPTLFMVAPLGGFDYLPALALWSLVGLAALAAAVWTALPAPERALLLLSPAVAINLVMGQNGAFTAALMIGGLRLMERRPIVAGILFGLLVFKPQLGVLLPVAVIAAGQWRTFVAAAATGAAVLAFSAAVFGVQAWADYLGPTLAMQQAMMTRGEGPFLAMMPSAFAAGRIFGLHGAALLLQLPFALLGAALAWRVMRGPASQEVRLAGVLLATFVATPQCFNYDLIPVAFAALVLYRHQQGRWAPLAFALWALPVLVMPLNAAHAPIGILLLSAGALALSGDLAFKDRRSGAGLTLGSMTTAEPT